MRRSTFIKSLITLPFAVKAVVEAKPYDSLTLQDIQDLEDSVKIAEPFEIDYSTKTIRYIGEEKTIDVMESYEYLIKYWDEEICPCPVKKTGPSSIYIDELTISCNSVA